MTYLRLNRLVVTNKGTTVYDETFPHNINIIRGVNGSGKSTIANFIYYALGGDFIEWLPEAKKCDFVFAEVNLNGKIVTIKREVIDKIMQPMQIFIGAFESAAKSAIEGWSLYPYRKSENKESFSQLLFSFLNFPEVTTENNESITLNQVLRLLYIDQISPINSFIKNVDFDSPLIRQAIGYLMLGVYDDKLFNEQLALREKRKRYNELNKEFIAIREVYKTNNQTLDLNRIDDDISKSLAEIGKIDEVITNRNLIVESTKRNETFDQIKTLSSQVEETSNNISQSLKEVSRLESEIFDSEDFIRELKIQNQALIESLSIREMLGELKVTYCPSCLSQLLPLENDNSCNLCKQELSDTDHRSRILRIRQELQNQIKESEYLLSKKKEKIASIKDNITVLKSKLALQSEKLNSYIKNSNSSIDRKYDQLLIKKGELSNQVENLLKEKQIISSFFNAKSRLDALGREIGSLEELISNKEAAQRKRMAVTMERIKYYSLLLLKGDGDYEDGFKNATRIEIDFSKNLYFVDGRNNFSASSLVILKNSIRFGIFFASLDLEFMRFPRFILCDNIEDKGMTEKRSHNFQRIIVDTAKGLKKDFQIIFTTSMIDESLEVSDFTIGDSYDSIKKSLKL